MTNEEAIIDLSVLAERMDSKNAEIPVFDISLEAVDMAIKALEHPEQNVIEVVPCGDAISRQAAVDAFERFIHELGIKDEPYNYGEMALSAKNVPSVNPQPKTGHWIDVFGGCKCSECDCLEGWYSNYCPTCGIKMVEPQKGEEV